MRKMNCRSLRREIEEVIPSNLLSASANDHLNGCAECNAFRDGRLKLQEMLSTLGAIEAPGDFDFRLRARLANEKRGAGQPFVMRNLSFGFRSAAALTILLLIGSTLLFVSLRTNNSLSANATKAPLSPTEQAQPKGQPESTTKGTVAVNVPTNTEEIKPDTAPGSEKPTTLRNIGSKRTSVAMRGNSPQTGGLKTREMASTAARVLRKWDATHPANSNVFPIGASYQSIKVSLDDGRGSKRTISLPSVSFGSQRVLSPGSSSLMASARSDW
jgi:hypothetical protein